MFDLNHATGIGRLVRDPEGRGSRAGARVRVFCLS